MNENYLQHTVLPYCSSQFLSKMFQFLAQEKQDKAFSLGSLWFGGGTLSFSVGCRKLLESFP
jgi:hypothetical protein